MQSTETYIRDLEKAKRELEAEVAEQSQTIAQQNDEYVQMSELLEETANRAEDLKACSAARSTFSISFRRMC